MNGECSGSIWGVGGAGGGEGRGGGGARAEVMALREGFKSLQSRPVLSGTLHVLPCVNLHCIHCWMYSGTSK